MRIACINTHLAMNGHCRPWVPHSQRGHAISTVGVLDKHRSLRGWLADLLRVRFEVQARQGVPFAEMLDLYDDSRCTLNQSLGFEVNFRLTEGASCGACVLTPDMGPDQDMPFDNVPRWWCTPTGWNWSQNRAFCCASRKNRSPSTTPARCRRNCCAAKAATPSRGSPPPPAGTARKPPSKCRGWRAATATTTPNGCG